MRRHAFHEGHQVEGLAVDGFVLAQAVGLRHWHVGFRQGADDAVLPPHVVRALQDVPKRRPPQHVGAAALVGELVGEVGVPAGDELEPQRRFEAVDAFRHPARHAVEIDALDAAARLPYAARRHD